MRRSGANSPAGDSLADRWRAARPPVAGLHLDSAACSRQSFAALDAAAQHARHEAEVGGYVAAEAAAAVLDAGRAAVAALSGLPDAEVVFPPARCTRWICCWAAGLGRTGRWLACPANTGRTWL
ncbi:pyridoxal-phosphate-dependent protein EgtE [Mycobacterium tuberculosis variant microti]|nr:pyridoxal-phosphate-dependent protein EgtE [Mycobacterium tuberculosis variant microti]